MPIGILICIIDANLDNFYIVTILKAHIELQLINNCI